MENPNSRRQTQKLIETGLRILKYRYRNVAKIDIEVLRDKFSIGSSVRYNDFMSNIDYIFTTDLINNGDPNFGVDALIPRIYCNTKIFSKIVV